MPISGSPTLTKIMAEFGADANPTLLDYLRGGSKLAYPGNPSIQSVSKTAAGLRLSQFAGGSREALLTISGGNRQANIRSLFNAAFGPPSEAVLVRFRIVSAARYCCRVTHSAGRFSMRLNVLIAMCGGAMLFAFAAYKEGSKMEALVMLGITIVVMGVALWMNSKDK